jgi:hypothetical protein
MYVDDHFFSVQDVFFNLIITLVFSLTFLYRTLIYPWTYYHFLLVPGVNTFCADNHYFCLGGVHFSGKCPLSI